MSIHHVDLHFIMTPVHHLLMLVHPSWLPVQCTPSLDTSTPLLAGSTPPRNITISQYPTELHVLGMCGTTKNHLSLALRPLQKCFSVGNGVRKGATPTRIDP